MRRNRPEQAIHKAVVQYLELEENLGSLTFFHVPNGGRRGKAEGATFKALGVRAGAADLVLLFPSGVYASIYFKTPTALVFPAQPVVSYPAVAVFSSTMNTSVPPVGRFNPKTSSA